MPLTPSQQQDTKTILKHYISASFPDLCKLAQTIKKDKALAESYSIMINDPLPSVISQLVI